MDKQEQIEEMAKDMLDYGMDVYPTIDSVFTETKLREQFFHVFLGYAERLIKKGYRKNPEGAVVIPKKVSCYDNVEERIRTFNLDGNKVDFTDEQIMAITSIFHYKEMQAEEIRKETAEKFAERADKRIAQCQGERDGYEAFTIDDKAKYDGDIVSLALLEICKEITGGKNE